MITGPGVIRKQSALSRVFDFLEVSNIPRRGDGQFLLKVCFRITTFQTGRFFKRVFNVSHRVTHDITYFGSCYLLCSAKAI